jgi:hypothetical protein
MPVKFKATYIEIGASPFIPDYRAFMRQFRYAETPEMPDDTDKKAMEQHAIEMIPKGYRFVKLEKIDIKKP